jgi:hypothetical protein
MSSREDSEHFREVLNLVEHVRKATAESDDRIRSKLAVLEKSIADGSAATDRVQGELNNLLRSVGRPRGGGSDPGLAERKEAVGLLETKHTLAVPKRDPALHPLNPSKEDVTQAELALKGLRALMHTTNIESVPLDQRKALSAFSMGATASSWRPKWRRKF